ncbi:MAG: RES family NAD+ phosphorylase [Acidimicrobiales bacterium]
MISRAHPHDFGSVQFDARSGADSRFSTIYHKGAVLPVLYGGEDNLAVASETIFHTVDLPSSSTRPRRVFLLKFLSWQWSAVATRRELVLVRLDDDGLARIGTSRADLIEGPRATYGFTRAWGEAIAEAIGRADGMWWHSRQAPDRRAAVLFQKVPRRSGGLRPGDLVGVGPALPFALPAGTEQLDEIALRFGTTVVRP